MAFIGINDPTQQTPRGFALFALGFRPFFLLAGIAALLLVPLWAAGFSGALALESRYGGIGWHAHEMLFGYTMAVVAGFLLTAVRNWTSVDTPTGLPLALLALLWLAGRVAPFIGAPDWLIAVVDLAFVPGLAIAVGIPLLKSGQRHNLVFLLLLALLTVANAMMHYALLGDGTSWRAGVDLALGLLVLLIVLVGGRVVPFFIERGLQLPPGHVRSWKNLEVLVMVSTALWLAVKLWAPGSPWLGAVAGIAAVIHGIRVAAWHTGGIWRVPLLWVLYLGFVWIVTGFALDALAGFGLAPSTLALHAFTSGGIGVLTLGMMARVSLGHTGRMMQSASVVNVAFALVNLAAAARVFGPLLFPSPYTQWIVAASVPWALAFLAFVAVYAPILIRPRADGRPG